MVPSIDDGDSTNIERAEMTSGPNSILFGLGAPGGTVALSSKFAQLRRTTTAAKSVVGSWDYFRHELDHNHVLIRGKLGLRLLGAGRSRLEAHFGGGHFGAGC